MSGDRGRRRGEANYRELDDGSRSAFSKREDRYAHAAARLLSGYAAEDAAIEPDPAGGAGDVQAIGRALRQRARLRLFVRLTKAGAVIAVFVALSLRVFFSWP